MLGFFVHGRSSDFHFSKDISHPEDPHTLFKHKYRASILLVLSILERLKNTY